MSLPLTRRIARAALLVGAAAAPLVGAGAASAAELPQVGDLGGLTSLDKAVDPGPSFEGMAPQAGPAQPGKGLPAFSRELGKSADRAEPVARRTAQRTARRALDTVTGTANEVGKTAQNPQGADLPLHSLDNTVPLKSLPISG